MSRSERYLMLGGVIVPLLAVVLGIVLMWGNGVGWLDLGIAAVMYAIVQAGITVGYHRLLTHRAFETYPVVRYGWAIAGSLAVQGTPIAWVADHRKHHAFTDLEGDPHSPHLHGTGFFESLQGLYHAHVGWLFVNRETTDERRYASELLEDRWMRRISYLYGVFFLATLGVPFLAGWILGGSLTAGLTALLWGGFIRIFLSHHFTWSINSVCHVFGSRRFAVEETDKATNVFWLAIPSFGEAWHHNHHAFPSSAVHGLKWYEIDLAASIIWTMEKLGLAWNVRRITPERQEERLTANGAAPPPPRKRPSVQDDAAAGAYAQAQVEAARAELPLG